MWPRRTKCSAALGPFCFTATGRQSENSEPTQLSVTTGADTFTLNPHANEAITASGHNEVFAYEAGFGQSTIVGFAATGAGHDLLEIQSAMFSNVTTLLSHAVQIGANVQITDPSWDTITLENVSKTALAANPTDFKFA